MQHVLWLNNCSWYYWGRKKKKEIIAQRYLIFTALACVQRRSHILFYLDVSCSKLNPKKIIKTHEKCQWDFIKAACSSLGAVRKAYTWMTGISKVFPNSRSAAELHTKVPYVTGWPGRGCHFKLWPPWSVPKLNVLIKDLKEILESCFTMFSYNTSFNTLTRNLLWAPFNRSGL